MTNAEIKVWHLFIDEAAKSVEKDFTENESRYSDNITLAIIMLEETIKEVGLNWKFKLNFESSFGIPEDSIDEFVDIMTFNAIRKLKEVIFK